MGDGATIALVGGHLALDFANTAGWHASDERLEHLNEYGDVLDWARRAGAIHAAAARELRAECDAHPRRASEALARAIELREAIYRIFAAVAQRKAPAADDLAALHAARLRAFAAATPAWRRGEGLELEWNDAADLDRPTYPIAVAAAELLASGDFARLRQCGNHPCGWLFLDTSRSGTRRWCSSADCGNLTRVRRFRAKQG